MNYIKPQDTETAMGKALALAGKSALPKQTSMDSKQDSKRTKPVEIRKGLCTIGELLQ